MIKKHNIPCNFSDQFGKISAKLTAIALLKLFLIHTPNISKIFRNVLTVI